MRAIKYECDAKVSISLCKDVTFPWGVAPEYWYLVRPMFTMDATEIGWDLATIMAYKQAGFGVAYWDGNRWWHCSPKQFPTPEAAFIEYTEKIKRKEPA